MSAGDNKCGTRSPAVRVVLLLTTLFLTSAFDAGPESRVQVDAGHLREVLAENLPHIHSAEVKLNDGSVVKTKRMKPESNALRVIPYTAVGERVIPYKDITLIRLDLGARRAWQITGGVLGGLTGTAIGAFVAQESSDTAYRVAGFAGMGAGALIGIKLGGRHRKILVIDVK